MKYFLTIFLIIILSDQGTSHNSPISISVPSIYNITNNDIVQYLTLINTTETTGSYELVIYYFSTGRETMEYTENGIFNINRKEGSIKALLKHKKDNKLVNVAFFTAYGTSKQIILQNLSKQLTSYFSTKF